MDNETGIQTHTEVKVKPYHIRYVRTLIRDKSTFNDENRQDTCSAFKLVIPAYWVGRPAKLFEENWSPEVVYDCSKCGATTPCNSNKYCHNCGAKMCNKETALKDESPLELPKI